MEYLFYEVVNTELQFHYKRIPSKALFLPFFEEGYFKEQPQGRIRTLSKIYDRAFCENSSW